MTKYAIARPCKGNQPRFFAGRYVAGESLQLMCPVTTGQPDEARAYEDRVVAELVKNFLNVLAGIATGTTAAPWIVMELPEAWL
jgi:hypothetical protein